MFLSGTSNPNKNHKKVVTKITRKIYKNVKN